MSWLLRDSEVLATLEAADGFRAKLVGLLGRTGIEGALLLPATRSVHTVGMRFALDIAWCDRDLVVLRTRTVAPWRCPPPVMRSRSVIEAEAGAFERWGLRVGDHLEVRL